MPWQKRFTLPAHTKGMHLVTDAVLRECQEGLKGVDIGIFTLNCLHTSAGLTVRRCYTNCRDQACLLTCAGEREL
jgi:thiamine phosphate synthase YjbQ (UPF0047 family)